MAVADRIVFVLSQYQLGGAEKQLATLLEHRPIWTRSLDIHTVTFAPPRSPEMVERYAALGLHDSLVERQAHSFVGFLIALLRTIRRLDPAVVHALLDHSTGTWGRLAAWMLRVPGIVMSDLSLAEEGGRIHFALRPFLDRRTHRFLPNAEAIADRLVSKGVPRERITVIPCGVDLAVFDPDRMAPVRAATRERWGLAPDAVVAGFLGRFSEVKRVDLLIEAVRSLPQSDRPHKLVLAGDGPTLPAVRSMVEGDAWLRANCRFLGMIDDTAGFLSAIDYLVLSSDTEGLPNAVLESMAMNRPVVATSVSDVPRVVEGAGFVAEPGNAAAFAGALAAMQRLTPQERHALGERGRRRVERDYDIKHVSERFWREHVALLPRFDEAVGRASSEVGR